MPPQQKLSSVLKVYMVLGFLPSVLGYVFVRKGEILPLCGETPITFREKLFLFRNYPLAPHGVLM
jgi:hypothetical protein